jgi:hypothetical protein
MKTISQRLWIVIVMITVALLSSLFGFSQKRLPDGTVVYPDGRKQLPNGTVIYPGGTIQKKGTTATLPDGTVIYPDGSRHKPGSVLFPIPTTPRHRTHSTGWIPPGQAKKIYGTKSARPFAPGQQKKWKRGNGNGKGNWKQDREDNDDRNGRGHDRDRDERDHD